MIYFENTERERKQAKGVVMKPTISTFIGIEGVEELSVGSSHGMAAVIEYMVHVGERVWS